MKMMRTNPVQWAVVCAVFLACVASSAAPKIPASAWRTGILRNVTSDTQSRVVGVLNNGQGVLGEKVRIVWHYTIVGGQYVYEADRTTRRRDKPLDLTINAPIKFAVVGMDLYLQDDSGKVYKLAIMTKALQGDANGK